MEVKEVLVLEVLLEQVGNQVNQEMLVLLVAPEILAMLVLLALQGRQVI